MNGFSDEDNASDLGFPAESSNEALLAYRKQLIQFGIFIAFLIVLFAFAAVFSALSSSASREGLKDCLAKALVDNGYTDVELESSYELRIPFTVAAEAYSVSGSRYTHAVIMRMTTMLGPVPAVFLYDASSAKADFVCYLSLDGRVERMLLDSTKYSLVEYWSVRLPSILSVPSSEVQR
ncbi:MAG: hypothetical protein K6G18_15640 [Treponema sp.]|nr:hypothetical protein [Treponema sp.]